MGLEGALETPFTWDPGSFSLLSSLVAAGGWLVSWPGAVTSRMGPGPEAAGWGCRASGERLHSDTAFRWPPHSWRMCLSLEGTPA